jgi:hypothetical protein
MSMKTCLGCNQILLLERFHKHPSSRGGYLARCIDCEKSQRRAYEEKNRERIREQRKQYRKNNPHLAIEWSAKYRQNHAADIKQKRKQRYDPIKNRARSLRQYGISLGKFEEMSQSQRGRCKICGVKTASLKVDHCHKTMIVRGLLCGKCNSGIGLFDDDPKKLYAAIDYLAAALGAEVGSIRRELVAANPAVEARQSPN